MRIKSAWFSCWIIGLPTKKTLWPLMGVFPHWRCSCIWYKWDGFKTGSLRSSRSRFEVIQLYVYIVITDTCNSWHYLAIRLFMCSWVPFCRLFLWFFPWFGKCSFFFFSGQPGIFRVVAAVACCTHFWGWSRFLGQKSKISMPDDPRSANGNKLCLFWTWSTSTSTGATERGKLEAALGTSSGKNK